MDPDLEVEEQRGNGHDKEQEVGSDLPYLMVLNRERSMSWILMPQTIQRIKEFCRQFDPDTDPEKLAESVQVNFASGNKGVLVMVAVERYKVIGHLLATADEWFGKKFATILQYELDEESKIDTEILKAGLEVVEKWGKKQGAVELRAFAIPGITERTFEVFYGFSPYRMLTRKSLREEPS